MWHTWWVFVIIRVVVGYGVNTVITKELTDLPSRPRTLAWKEGFGVLLWVLLSIAMGALPAFDDRKMYIIAGMGSMSSLASYYHWRAMEKSISKTTLLDQFDDAMAFSLACIFLGEGKFITPLLVGGMLVSLSAAIAFVWRHKEKEGIPPMLWWVAISGAIWGVTMFGTRYFATNNVPLTTYGLAWNAGSYLGALTIRYAYAKKEAGDLLSRRRIGAIVPFAILAAITLSCHFLSKAYAPLVVVQPIYQLTGLVIPTLIGLLLYEEKKGLTWKDGLLLLASATGAGMIVASY